MNQNTGKWFNKCVIKLTVVAGYGIDYVLNKIG